MSTLMTKVEYSPTALAKCKECGHFIDVMEPRCGFDIKYMGHPGFQYKHLACVKSARFDEETVGELDGYKTLKAKDKAAVKKLFDEYSAKMALKAEKRGAKEKRNREVELKRNAEEVKKLRMTCPKSAKFKTTVSNDALVKIFQFLDFKDLLQSTPFVSKQFYRAYCDDELWRYWCNTQYNIPIIAKQLKEKKVCCSDPIKDPCERKRKRRISEDNQPERPKVEYRRAFDPAFFAQLLPNDDEKSATNIEFNQQQQISSTQPTTTTTETAPTMVTTSTSASSSEQETVAPAPSIAPVVPIIVKNWYTLFLFLRKHCCYNCFAIENMFNMCKEAEQFTNVENGRDIASKPQCGDEHSPLVMYSEYSRGMLCSKCESPVIPFLHFVNKITASSMVDKHTLETIPFYSEHKSSNKKKYSPVLLRYRENLLKKLAEYNGRVNVIKLRNKKRDLLVHAIAKEKLETQRHGKSKAITSPASSSAFSLNDGPLKEYIYDDAQPATVTAAMEAVQSCI